MYRVVHNSNIEDAWPTVEPWLKKAVGEVSMETDLEVIKSDLCSGISMLVIGYEPQMNALDLVLVAEPLRVGGVPTLVIRWAAGRGLESWLQDLSVFENFALSRGFKQVQIWGRPGWSKLLKDRYSLEFIVLNHVLQRGVH